MVICPVIFAPESRLISRGRFITMETLFPRDRCFLPDAPEPTAPVPRGNGHLVREGVMKSMLTILGLLGAGFAAFTVPAPAEEGVNAEVSQARVVYYYLPG